MSLAEISFCPVEPVGDGRLVWERALAAEKRLTGAGSC